MEFSSAIMITYTTMLALARVVVGDYPMTLTLERLSFLDDAAKMVEFDHGRMQQSFGATFPLQGKVDVFYSGLYYARIQIGSPPVDFHLQIDSGSDVTWIDCTPCNGCPNTTNLPIRLEFYDHSRSSTAHFISCSDERCKIAAEASKTTCLTHTDQCGYDLSYLDRTSSSGPYVSDLLHLQKIISNTSTRNFSIPFLFGCSTSRREDLTLANVVDGMLGLGQSKTSAISQLAREGSTPRAFAHCLRGDDVGGGTLIFGIVEETNMVYTPFVLSGPQYFIDMQNILVNGRSLVNKPSILTTSFGSGALVDSGTTLSYLPEAAYKLLISAITAAVGSESAPPIVNYGFHCWNTNSSFNDLFPRISLIFAGNALMDLKPQDYLIHLGDIPRWCVGFQKSHDPYIILGDLVLKDKIVVYDLENQRLGWVNHNCSLPMKVFEFHGDSKPSYSSRASHYGLLFSSILSILLHLNA